MFGRVFKVLLILLAVAIAGLTGFAYFGDLSPEQTEIREPVQLDVD